jgi:hypothetical protein
MRHWVGCKADLGVREASKSHCFVENRSLARPGRRLVTSPTELPPDSVQRRAVLKLAVMVQIFLLAVAVIAQGGLLHVVVPEPRAVGMWVTDPILVKVVTCVIAGSTHCHACVT